MNKLAIIIMLVAIVVIGCLVICFYKPQGTKVTSKIVDKYESPTCTIIPVDDSIVPICFNYYYFKLENGDTITVSYDDYNKYKIGDNYTYFK